MLLHHNVFILPSLFWKSKQQYFGVELAHEYLTFFPGISVTWVNWWAKKTILPHTDKNSTAWWARGVHACRSWAIFWLRLLKHKPIWHVVKRRPQILRRRWPPALKAMPVLLPQDREEQAASNPRREKIVIAQAWPGDELRQSERTRQGSPSLHQTYQFLVPELWTGWLIEWTDSVGVEVGNTAMTAVSKSITVITPVYLRARIHSSPATPLWVVNLLSPMRSLESTMKGSWTRVFRNIATLGGQNRQVRHFRWRTLLKRDFVDTGAFPRSVYLFQKVRQM